MKSTTKLAERTNEALTSLAKNSLYFKSNTLKQSTIRRSFSESPDYDKSKIVHEDRTKPEMEMMDEVESVSELITEKSEEEEPY